MYPGLGRQCPQIHVCSELQNVTLSLNTIFRDVLSGDGPSRTEVSPVRGLQSPRRPAGTQRDAEGRWPQAERQGWGVPASRAGARRGRSVASRRGERSEAWHNVKNKQNKTTSQQSCREISDQQLCLVSLRDLQIGPSGPVIPPPSMSSACPPPPSGLPGRQAQCSPPGPRSPYRWTVWVRNQVSNNRDAFKRSRCHMFGEKWEPRDAFGRTYGRAALLWSLALDEGPPGAAWTVEFSARPERPFSPVSM